MLDQTFSTHNFARIYDLARRKGHIKVEDMPDDYRELLTMHKSIKDKINEIKKIKKTDMSQEDIGDLEKNKKDLLEVEMKKEESLNSFLSQLSENVRSSAFRFKISKYVFPDDGKEYFRIEDESLSSFFAMKQLQYNVKKTFKIQQANRHAILSNIKVFLNSKIPVYVIRTDISGFYESIQQKLLFKMIENNTLLNYKSKSFIKALIRLYDEVKDNTKVPNGIGVPRGIGISAYLAELYMRDMDQSIINSPEVMFYARYVDDIFMILSFLPAGMTKELYYADLTKRFSDIGLGLKQENDGSGKCFIKDLTVQNAPLEEINYLGYKLCIVRKNGELKTTFALSDNKIKRIREKLDKAFLHFKLQSAKDIRQARRDLIDSINYISGNMRLYKSKSNVKVGLFYNNDLLDDMRDFDNLTQELHAKKIEPYSKLSHTKEIENAFKKKISKVDFKQRWVERKMYKFSMSRLEEISRWL